jgi:hypothetical protein
MVVAGEVRVADVVDGEGEEPLEGGVVEIAVAWVAEEPVRFDLQAMVEIIQSLTVGR